jgi:hypothetical protein
MAYATINDPSAHFQNVAWTGDGNSTKAITNTGNSNLQPDWVWLKNRTDAENNTLADTTRGVTKRLVSNTTAAEDTNGIASVQSDGFTVSASYNGNTNAKNYVAYQWKANGGTTSSNSSGSITSTVQANTTAGFSIVSYTGNGTAGATIGHGLGVAPSWIIVKQKDATMDWNVFHHKNTSAPETDFLVLNSTDATADASNRWNDTMPSSSVITIGDTARVNDPSGSYIMYVFAEKQGYSKFGSYKGNSNVDGTFVYLGFKPAWLMVKRTSNTGTWLIWNNASDTYNMTSQALKANTNNAQTSGYWNIDFLSNGFKLRAIDNELNGGATFVYAAFAAEPLVGTNNVFSLAR